MQAGLDVARWWQMGGDGARWGLGGACRGRWCQVVQVGWGGGVGGQGTVQLTYYVIKAASRHEI